MILVETAPIAAVVDLVNEYADITRSVAGESDEPYPPLEHFEASAIEPFELVAIANDLHRAFAQPRTAAHLLNELADHSRLSHRLTSDGRLAWYRSEGSDHLAALAVATLIDFVHQHGNDRFGTCGADRCVDVFVDTSQGGTRSYCSDRCHSRARVARWRARQKAGASARP